MAAILSSVVFSNSVGTGYIPSVINQSPVGVLVSGFSTAFKTLNLPTTTTPKNSAAFVGDSFKNQFYNRIIITPPLINLGNISAASDQTVSIWNGYFEPKNLSNVDRIALSGVSDSLVFPQSIGAISQLEFNVSVSGNGAAVLDGRYDFTIGIETVSLPVKGNRITLFDYAHTGELIESYKFKTLINYSENGAEQRIKLAQGARKLYQMNYILEGKDWRTFQNLFYDWQSRVFAVKDRYGLTELSSGVSAGANVIQCDTVNKGFLVGSSAIVESSAGYDIVIVSDIQPTSLTFIEPLSRAYASGDRAYPVDFMRAGNDQQIAHVTGELSEMRLGFISSETVLLTNGAFSNYLNTPIFPFFENWQSEPVSQYSRHARFLDNGVGQIAVDDLGGVPRINRQVEIVLESKNEITKLIQFFNHVSGAFKSFWFNARTPDLIPVSNLLSVSQNITVEHSSYSLNAKAEVGRDHIAIELITGEIFYRKITGFVDFENGTEQITIDQSLGVAVNVSEFRSITFLNKVRFLSDLINIQRFDEKSAYCKVSLKGVINEL